MAAIGAHAEYVAKRAGQVSPALLAKSIALLPFLLLGLVARHTVGVVVWVFSFAWFAVVDGWNMAAPKDART